MKIPLLTAAALVATLMLNACGGGTPSTPGDTTTSTIDPVQVSGTITGPTVLPGEVYLATDREITFANKGRLTGSALNLSLSRVPEDRTFFDLIPSAGSSCTVSGTVPAGASPRVSIWTELLTTSTGGDPLGLITETVVQGGAMPGSTVARLYSDRAATVAGTVTCGAGYPPFTFDLKLRAGWNALEFSQSDTATSLTNLAPTARRSIVARAFTPTVGIVLDPVTLVFSTDSTVTARASFYQIGGYSGPVTLSTDVPGLTVEPSTVTLPALAAQATRPAGWGRLSRQSVDIPLTFTYTGAANLSAPFTLFARDAAGATVGAAQGSVQTNRPGMTLFPMTYSPQLPASGTVKIDVCANSVGGFSGDVTFSAKNLPAGVTATPVTATLTSSACVNVPLSASGSAKSGKYSITLTATSGTVNAEVPLDITVLGPSVNVSFVTSTVPVYVGGTGTATVDVSGQYGFSGPTTISLSGLPTGVTVDAKTVTVTTGAVTRVMLTLRAAADAPPGTVQIKATSPDLGSDPYYSNSATLSVRPARVSIVSGYATVAATSGVWQIIQNNYDTSTIALSGVSGTTRNVNLPHAVSRLFPVPGGVIALTISGTNAGSFVKDDGTFTALPRTAFTDNDTFASTTDAQGRVWLTNLTYTTSGGSTVSLRVWTPSTGAVKTVDSTNLTGSGWLSLSPDGLYVVYGIAYTGTILKYRTDTLALTKVTVTAGFSNIAVNRDGQLWLSSYGNSLTRVNADGTSTIFNGTTGTLVGFDQQAPTILWGNDSGSVFRIDTTSVTVNTVPLSSGQLVTAVTAPSGGLYAVTKEYQMSASDLSYLSILK